MKQIAALGDDVDRARMNQLELLVRESRRENLTERETEVLAKFWKSESTPDSRHPGDIFESNSSEENIGDSSKPDDSAEHSGQISDMQNVEDPKNKEKGDQEGDMKFKQIKETGKMFTSAPSVVMATTSLLISMEKISKWFVT